MTDPEFSLKCVDGWPAPLLVRGQDGILTPAIHEVDAEVWWELHRGSSRLLTEVQRMLIASALARGDQRAADQYLTDFVQLQNSSRK